MIQKINNVSVASLKEVLGLVSLETHRVSVLVGDWVDVEHQATR